MPTLAYRILRIFFLQPNYQKLGCKTASLVSRLSQNPKSFQTILCVRFYADQP